MDVEMETGDENIDEAHDIAVITNLALTEINNQHQGSTTEIQIESQDSSDHACVNVETTLSASPHKIQIKNEEIGNKSTDTTTHISSVMEIQLSDSELTTVQTDVHEETTHTLTIELKNQKCITPTVYNTQIKPTMEMQVNYHSSNVDADAVEETTPLKTEIKNPETDDNSKNAPTICIQISNQELISDHKDANKDTEQSMEIQTNQDDISCIHTETPLPMEVQINNERLLPGHSETDMTDNYYQHSTLFTKQTLLPLYSTSWSKTVHSKENDQTYVRGCKWSPDGTCCLTVVNNDGIHMGELSTDLLSGSVNIERPTEVLTSVIHVKESGLVYDFCWYPFMNSQIPASCGWITTKQRAPVQLWDAFDGSLRASYRGFNAVDEMEPAISITFSVDGLKIIAGYKKVLKTFDIERPGREFAEHKVTSPASCFAVSNNLLAMGSWNTSISLYSVSERGTYKSVGKLHGHSGGVTHMQFTPDGTKIVSGARKDHRLLVWDIRYYRRPLNILSRAVDTNQRIYFDISPCGRYLVTGGTDGNVKVWDVDHVNWTDTLDMTNTDADGPTRTLPLHKDCCNSVSIHPYMPILATGSGQHHLDYPKVSDSEKSSENTILDESSDDERNERDIEDSSAIDMKYSSRVENKLVIWWTAEFFNSSLTCK